MDTLQTFLLFVPAFIVGAVGADLVISGYNKQRFKRKIIENIILSVSIGIMYAIIMFVFVA